MVDIAKAKIVLAKPELKKGLQKYISIMQRFRKTNVTVDLDFQKDYDFFYRVRRSADFRKPYFEIMEKLKDESKFSFEDIFKRVKSIKGTYEISFSSKLLHTLDPNYPIWDSIVAKQHFGIIAPYYQSINRERSCCDLYEAFRKEFNKYLDTEEAVQLINLFDIAFPNIDIINGKKVDFILWQYR